MTAGPPPFPFVVCAGRSGSTLLRTMLDAHPEMAIPYESYFIAGMLWMRSKLERPDGFDTAAFLDALGREPRFLHLDLPLAEVAAQLRSDPPHDLPEAFRGVYAAWARHEGKPRYGDKTPTFVLILPELGELFPELRVVHLIRDGRDVAMSYHDTPFGPRTTVAAAVLWERHVRLGRAAGLALGPQRYLEVRYEDLVADPEATLRAMCTFIDLPFDPVMVDHRRRLDSVMTNLRSRDSFANLARPVEAGLRSWADQMSLADQEVFSVVAGSLLAACGYPPGPEPDAGRRRRIRAAATLTSVAQVAVERFKTTRVATRIRPAVHRVRARLMPSLR